MSGASFGVVVFFCERAGSPPASARPRPPPRSGSPRLAPPPKKIPPHNNNQTTKQHRFAIREERDYVTQDDFMRAVRKLCDAKKLESTLNYDSAFGDGGQK